MNGIVSIAMGGSAIQQATRSTPAPEAQEATKVFRI